MINSTDFSITDLPKPQQILYAAVKTNSLEVAKSVFELYGEVGINFQVSNLSQATLINMAVEYGDLPMINFLLEHHPELHHFNGVGYTPLGQAAFNGRMDIAEVLHKAGADVNGAGNVIDNPFLPKITGITPLHLAALTGNIPMMEYLLTKGANVNSVKVQTRNQTAQLNSLFIQNIISGKETALDIAERRGHTEAISFLKSRGAHNAGCTESLCPIL